MGRFVRGDRNLRPLPTSIRFEPQVLRRLTLLAAQQRTDVSELVRVAVDRYLDDWDTAEETAA